jgi:uncharacterized DUF497 family protein
VWLEDTNEKLDRKHNVVAEEVDDVLLGQPHFRFAEKGFRHGEDVYVALGRTTAGRLLSVFFVHKDNGSALVVFARDMSAAEKRIYARR